MKDIRGPTMAQAGYHHANHLVSEIRDELKNNKIQMLALLQEHNEDFTQEEETTQDTIAAANAATQISVQTETLKVLNELQKQLKTSLMK